MTRPHYSVSTVSCLLSADSSPPTLCLASSKYFPVFRIYRNIEIFCPHSTPKCKKIFRKSQIWRKSKCKRKKANQRRICLMSVTLADKMMKTNLRAVSVSCRQAPALRLKHHCRTSQQCRVGDLWTTQIGSGDQASIPLQVLQSRRRLSPNWKHLILALSHIRHF